MANTTVPAELINTATPLGRRNILINGDYGIYQRAQQVTGIGANASTYYTADRWLLEPQNTSGRLTMTAGTEAAPTESNVTTSLKLDCTTADTSTAANEYMVLAQKIEGFDVQQFKKGTSGAKQFTLSFWVKSETTSHTFVAELFDHDNSRQISKTFAVTSSWSKVEITYPADTTGAFGNDANNSLSLFIWLVAGSSYSGGTLNSSAWAGAVAANRAAGADNFFSSTSNELYITAVQLEVGDTATEFEILTKGEKEKLCHRYFQKYAFGDLASGSSDAGIFNGSMWATTLFYGMFYFPRGETRPAPTLTLSSATDCTVFAGGSTSDTTSADFTDRTSYGCEVTLGTNTITAGRGAWVRLKSGNFLEVDAEL